MFLALPMPIREDWPASMAAPCACDDNACRPLRRTPGSRRGGWTWSRRDPLPSYLSKTGGGGGDIGGRAGGYWGFAQGGGGAGGRG